MYKVYYFDSERRVLCICDVSVPYYCNLNAVVYLVVCFGFIYAILGRSMYIIIVVVIMVAWLRQSTLTWQNCV